MSIEIKVYGEDSEEVRTQLYGLLNVEETDGADDDETAPTAPAAADDYTSDPSRDTFAYFLYDSDDDSYLNSEEEWFFSNAGPLHDGFETIADARDMNSQHDDEYAIRKVHVSVAFKAVP